MRGWRQRALVVGLLCLSACSSDPPLERAGTPPAASAPATGASAPAIRGSRIPQPRVAAAGDLTLRAGGTARLVLRVSLPPGLHVQSNAPKDANLIPTVLNVRVLLYEDGPVFGAIARTLGVTDSNEPRRRD